jgi:hypothetical protein
LGYNYTIEYKKGKENKVADALSRAPHATKLLAISQLIPVWIDQVTDSYTTDATCLDLITKLSIHSQVVPHYTFSNGLLRYDDKLVIGTNGNLRHQLLEAFHKSALGGYSGERATYQRIKLVFYWPQMKQQVKTFVKDCPVCQKNKSEHIPTQAC